MPSNKRVYAPSQAAVFDSWSQDPVTGMILAGTIPLGPGETVAGEPVIVFPGEEDNCVQLVIRDVPRINVPIVQRALNTLSEAVMWQIEHGEVAYQDFLCTLTWGRMFFQGVGERDILVSWESRRELEMIEQMARDLTTTQEEEEKQQEREGEKNEE